MQEPDKADTSLLTPHEEKPNAALEAPLRWSEATGEGDDRLSPDGQRNHKDTHGGFLRANFVHSSDRSNPLDHELHKTSALKRTAQALMLRDANVPTDSALRKTAQMMVKAALHPGAAAGLGALVGAPIGAGLSASKQEGEMAAGERQGFDPYLIARATVLAALLGGGGGLGVKYAPEILAKGRQAGESLSAAAESGPTIRAAQELLPELQAAAGATGRAANRVADESLLKMLFRAGG